ncbi:MAG: hypothetical protein ACI9VR_005368 [Cognaticolwellia sp.]|jgi:hypothetical protein
MLWSLLLACGSQSTVSQGTVSQGTVSQGTVSAPPFELGERLCTGGRVTEILGAESYTYIAFVSPDGVPHWLATLSSSTIPEVGQNASFVEVAQQENFHSARLEREFLTLSFGFVASC